MLNIVRIKRKQIKKYIDHKEIYVDRDRYFPPSTQEWLDSIYSFKKSSLRLLPFAKNHLKKILTSYFNIFNEKKEAKLRFRRIRNKRRRLTSRKFFLSRPEIKHTSDTVNITVYIYNRPYSYLLKKIKTRSKQRWLFFFYLLKSANNKKKRVLKVLHTILKKKSRVSLNLKFLAQKTNFVLSEKNKIFFIKKFTKRLLRKHKLLLRFKRMVAFNRSRFNINYLYSLGNVIEKLYKKKIEFNIVTLKNYYLNSDILSQLIVNKIIKNKNRGKALKVMRHSINRVKVLRVFTFLQHGYKVPSRYIKQNLVVKNFTFNKTEDFDHNINQAHSITLAKENYKNSNNSNLQQQILKSTKGFMINGIRIEGFGRLTKRIKAQRKVHKTVQIGTLQNINSSKKKASCLILKGNKSTNIQYTAISSKARIGAFGIKGWVSSY